MIAKNMYVYINPRLADGDCAQPTAGVTTSLLDLRPSVLRLELCTVKNKKHKSGRRKTSWLQTHQPIYIANSHLSNHSSLPLLGRCHASPRPWMGLVLTLGEAGAARLASHRLFGTQMAPGERCDCSHSKMKLREAGGNALLANGHGDGAGCWER